MRYAANFSNQVVHYCGSNAGIETVCFRVQQKVREASALTGRTDRSLLKTVSAEAADVIAGLSLAPWSSFLQNMTSFRTVVPPDRYTILWFEPIHNLHLVVSILLKAFWITFLDFSTLILHPRGWQTGLKLLTSICTPLLRTCNSLLAVSEKNHSAAGLHVEISEKEPSSSLDRLFM